MMVKKYMLENQHVTHPMINSRIPGYKSLHRYMVRTGAMGFFLALLLAGPAQAESIVIAGTGASQKLFREVAEGFEKANPDCQAAVPNSVGSRGGIRQLLAGKADLARVSRPLKDKERADGLVYTGVAETQVVFAVHPSVEGVQSLTVDQVNDIYAGRISNWKEIGGPDHGIFPLIRDGGTTLRTLLKYVPHFEKMPAAAKPTFSSLETKELLLEHPYTIGALPMTIIVGLPLKTIAIEGISTGRALVSKPTIPLQLGIVYREPVAGCASRFIQYFRTDTAHKIINNNDSIPVDK
jgi:phosphate transport system substrate-binding protein